MRTLAVEASQGKRRISRCKAIAADPELKVSNGEGEGGGGGGWWVGGGGGVS